MQPSPGCLSCRAGPCTLLCDIPALLLGGPVRHRGWGAGLRDSLALLHCQAPNTGGFHISPWMRQDRLGSPGSWGSAGGSCPEGWGCPPARRHAWLCHGPLSLPGDGHSSELPVTHPVHRGFAQVSEGDVLLVQPRSSLHFPAIECLRDTVCSRVLAGTVLPGLPACPGELAVTQCPTGSLLVGVASAAQRCRLRVQAVTAQPPCGWDQPLPLSRGCPTPSSHGSGSEGSVLGAGHFYALLSSSISTTLRHPGLLPHQQHRLHGGGGAGRAAAGAAQARALSGLLQPASTWDAAAAGPVPGPAASPCATHQLSSPGEGLPRWAQPSCLPHTAAWARMLLPLLW